jgi:hypothetical protein
MKAHTLITSPTRQVFSEDAKCLSAGYVGLREFLKEPYEEMMVDGGGIRQMVLVKHETKNGDAFYFADRVTGTLYAEDGRCQSSDNLFLRMN